MMDKSSFPKKTSILIVDVDTELSVSIKKYLLTKGYMVSLLSDGDKAVKHILTRNPDLVVLERLLPGINGIEVCNLVRHHYTNPILMLSEKNEENIIITALRTGVDNYLIKPVTAELLYSHVDALLRRSQNVVSADRKYLIQDLKINLKTYSLYKNSLPVLLTHGEFEVLAMLVRNVGVLVTRHRLYREIRGIEYDGINRSLDIRISTLRKKLGDDLPPYRYIKTIRGQGYVLVA